MSGLTFVSTTSTPEQMRADLGLPEPTAPPTGAADTGMAASVTSAPDPEPTAVQTPESTPAAAPVTPEPASAAPSPEATAGAEDKTVGDEYPELGGLSAAEFAALPAKTQRRIAKLTRRLRETEARLSTPATPAGAPAPPTTPGQAATAHDRETPPETPAGDPATTPDLPPGFRAKPESDQFETWAEYEEALVDWKIDLRDAKRTHAEQQAAETRRREAERTAVQETLTAFQARRDQAKTEYPDFDEVVTDAPIEADDPRKLQDLERLVVEARAADGTPIGPDLLYHLGKHKDDLDRLLAAKTPVHLAMMLGAIQRDVELTRPGKAPAAAPARPSPKVTSAPAPVRPVAGASAVAVDLDDSLPQAEWERRREAQLRGRSDGLRR